MSLKLGFNTRWIRDEQVAATGALYTFTRLLEAITCVVGLAVGGYGNAAHRFARALFPDTMSAADL